MFELRNQSPFVAKLLPSMMSDGAESALVIVKGTYDLGATGGGGAAAARGALSASPSSRCR